MLLALSLPTPRTSRVSHLCLCLSLPGLPRSHLHLHLHHCSLLIAPPPPNPSYTARAIAPKSGRTIGFEMILRGFHLLRDEDLLPKACKRRHNLSPAYPFNFHCSPQLRTMYSSHSVLSSRPRTCCEARSDHGHRFTFKGWLELRSGSRLLYFHLGFLHN